MLDDWQPPTEWGVGAHAKNLSNLYVYFWRWAAWKVFENSGGDETDQAGIVSFIAPTGWLDGAGFQQMRCWLNEWCSHIWILDLSPEGHQAPTSTQVFEAMRQPVAIVTAVRVPEHQDTSEVRYHRVPAGDRSSKFAHIADLGNLDDSRWEADQTRDIRRPKPADPARVAAVAADANSRRSTALARERHDDRTHMARRAGPRHPPGPLHVDLLAQPSDEEMSRLPRRTRTGSQHPHRPDRQPRRCNAINRER